MHVPITAETIPLVSKLVMQKLSKGNATLWDAPIKDRLSIVRATRLVSATQMGRCYV